MELGNPEKVMPKLNHKWKKNPDFQKEGGFYAQYKCEKCGCVKTLHTDGHGYYSTYWERSGQDLGFRSKGPECIDWNDNSLD